MRPGSAFDSAFRTLRDSKLLRKPAPIDEGALRLARERGARAEALVGDDLLVEAFKTVESVYMRGWKDSASDDVNAREQAWLAISVLRDLQGALGAIIRDGAVAAEALVRSRARNQ